MLAVINSLSFIAVSRNHSAKIHALKEQFLPEEFSTFTPAVCDNKSNEVYCKDELFVNCNGNISRATDVAECNGMKFDAPEITGVAVFGKSDFFLMGR